MQRRKAFTLIELLVVIAIIAILAAILFPVFAQAKMAAKKASDLAGMKQIGTALHIYFADFDDMAPMASFNASPVWENHYRWSSSLCIGPYLKNKAILKSPVDTASLSALPGWAVTALAPRQPVTISYMANSIHVYNNETFYFGTNPPAVQDGLIAAGRAYHWDVPEQATSMTKVENPSELIMLAGGVQDIGAYWTLHPDHNTGCLNVMSNEWKWCDTDLHEAWLPWFISTGSWFGGEPLVTKIWRQFSNSSNFVMSDSSAKSLRPGQLLNGAVLNQKRWVVTPATGQ